MRKLLLSFLLNALAGSAIADEITIGNVTVPQGGKSVVNIILTNPNHTYTAGQMLLTLPDGVESVINNSGYPETTRGERIVSTSHSIGASHLDDNNDQFTIFSISSEAIPETEGVLFSVMVIANASIAVGTELEGSLTSIEMTTTDASPVQFDNKTFTITIGEPADTRTILDETSTTMPEASDGAVDVRLNRTIKAGEWSTIVLPFTATGEQVKAAFGEDVALASFTAWESEEDDEGAIVGINVTFANANVNDGIEANVPMLIRVSEDVTTAAFDGVTIEPDDAPEVRVGKTSKTRGYFYGTYIATKVPAENLFLSGSKFWYSTGKTNIKGYRGYFDFRDVLDAYYDASQVKMNFFVCGIETHINDILPVTAAEETMYDLSGRRLVKASQRGIYIVNGKKVVINNKN